MRIARSLPVSILHKFIAGRYRPVRVAERPMTACCKFIKNARLSAAVQPARMSRVFTGCTRYNVVNTVPWLIYEMECTATEAVRR